LRSSKNNLHFWRLSLFLELLFYGVVFVLVSVAGVGIDWFGPAWLAEVSTIVRAL